MITSTDKEPRKRAVAYIRVSSIGQKDNESPNTQKIKIKQYAESNNIEIVEWFEDIAKSAKTANRDGLQQLLKFALKEREQIDHMIVYKMSRASRDAKTFFVDIVSRLQTRGITIRSATETFDETPGGQFMQLLHLGMAQFDNGIKSEYTKDNMQNLANQGYYQHPPVVGYSTCKIRNESGKYRPSLKQNEMAPKVKLVLERFSMGDMSKAELTRYAEEVGLRSRYGKVLGRDSINRLLINATYAGLIKDCHTGFEVRPGKHDGIISEQTYNRNQMLVHGQNSRLEEVHLKKNEMYVLKGTLRCVECNKLMYASAPKTGNGGHSPRYHCGKCQQRSIPARLVHQDFEDMLKSIKPTEGTLKLYKEVLIREANHQLGRINKEVEQLRDELTDISNKRFAAIDKFTMGDLTKEEKNDFIDALDIRKLAAEAQLEDAEGVQALRENEIEYAINFMDQVDKQWADASFDLQQQFQKMIFPNGVAYDAENRRFGTSEISVLYRLADIKKSPQGTRLFNLVAGAGLEPATSWL